MKKLYYLIVIVAILGLVLTGCSLLSNVGQVPATEQSAITYLTKGTEAEPEPFPLYAGQHDLVGQVLVWDDGETLCVKYQLSDTALEEGWLLYETHLAVAADLKGIPTNKAGNPKVGNFPYGNDELEGVESYKKCGIPIPDVVCDVPFVIAAHAAIKKEECETISGKITPTLAWTRSSESVVANFPGYGTQWDPTTDGFTIPLTGELVWDGGTGVTQNFTGLSTRNDVGWASWDYAASVPRGGDYTGNSDLRRFNATFNLDANVAANITSAALRMPDFAPDAIPINDNVYIFLHNVLQFWGGTRVEGAAGDLTTFQGMAGVPATATYLELDWGGLDLTGWYIPGEFPDLNIADFKDGPNELDVFTEENQEGGGMAELVLTLEYAYEECTTYDESAWAANEVITEEEEGTLQFVVGGKSWATYFNYTVECPVCLGCPEIIDQSDNIEVLASPPPADVRVGQFENDDKVRVWKEFEGPLPAGLYYDLDAGLSARADGPPNVDPYIPAGTDVCIYYVHLDNVGPSSTVQHTGQITFGADILGLIISGGSLGTFKGRDLMFAADNKVSGVGNPGTTYPTTAGVDYWRGFDVKYGSNLDDAIFNGPIVDFTMWVVNAHDSFRVILPMVPVPCE